MPSRESVRGARSRAFALGVVVALALPACSSIGSASTSLLAPVLDFFGAGPDDDCDGQEPIVGPPPRTSVARTLRVGTWNMHYLGPSEERPREERDLECIADAIRASGVAVLALQEIGVPPGSWEGRSATLDAIFAHLDGDGAADWTYRLCGSVEETSEWIGLAWDRRVLREECEPMLLPPEVADGEMPFIPLFGNSAAWERPPFAVQLSAGPGLSDFVFVPVHLTARIETFFLVEDATAIREAEGSALAARLASIRRRFRDRDVVVLGDFNTDLVGEDVTEDLVLQGMRDLNCRDVATYSWGMPLDRILVPRAEPEFARSRFHVVAPPRGMSWDDFEERCSDHAIAVCDVVVMPDDD